MADQTRLETILKMLLHYKTGSLEPQANTFNDRVENLAYHLSGEGVIVLVGELDPAQRSQWGMHVRLWMHTYAKLYYLLNNWLYNLDDEPVIYMADQKYPIMVVFEAKTLIVVRMLTNLVIPYVALRQSDGNASRAELRGLIDTMLDELGASQILADKKNYIRTNAIDYLETLLKSDIQQVSLTNFSQEFLIDTGMTQTRVKQTKRPDSIPGLEEQKITRPMKPVASPANIIPLPPLPKRRPDSGGDDNDGGLVGLLNFR